MARDEEGKVIFDQEEQAELDRIIAERVSRVKKELPEDYEDLKAIADELGELGYSGNSAEKRAALKAYRDSLIAESELQELEEQANEQGTSPALLKEIREARKEAKEAKEAFEALKAEKENAKKSEEEKKAKEEAVKQMYVEFEELHPEVDIKELEQDDRFLEYIEGKNGTLVQLYDRYSKFIGRTEEQVITKVKDKSERSTGGGGTKDTSGNGYGLTPSQLQMLNDYNKGKTGRQIMTPKEFKEML